MLVSLTVGKVDAGVTVLLTPDKRLIEFPSILLPPNISSGSIVDIQVSRNAGKEDTTESTFRALQDRIFQSFGASEPASPVLRCRNATQTSVVLEWDPVQLATADLLSLSLYRNGQKAGNIPRPTQMHSTKISGLAVDTEYTFHLVLRTSAGVYTSDKVAVRTHKMTDLSGITITTGILPASMRERVARSVDKIGAKIVDGVRIDTTHFVTTEGRGAQWEKAVETNIPVVRPEWIDACEKNGRILGVTKFYLDAMRPGPPSEETLPRANQSQKDLPAAPAASDTADGQTSGQEAESAPVEGETDERPAAGKGEEKEESDSEDDGTEEGEEPVEPKARATQPHEEQKVRAQDFEHQKLALRSNPSVNRLSEATDRSRTGEASEADESGASAGPGEDGEDTDGVKPAATPDGASSFQEVEL